MNYENLKDATIVAKVIASLKNKNVNAEVFETGKEVLEKIKELIPKGASVISGASKTLGQVGYTDHLKSGTHGWNNLQEKIVAETDVVKQSLLRKQSSIADFYLGSVHAIAESGEFVIASATGSQLPSIVHNASNLIFVVSTKKIMATLEDALKRVREHVFPQEDARMKEAGYGGSFLAKILIFANEHPMLGRKVHLLFVNENLGF